MAPHINLDEAARDRFLQFFDAKERSCAWNLILKAIRNGPQGSDPETVIRLVSIDLATGPQSDTREKLRVLMCNSPLTMTGAATYAIMYEALPKDQRRSLKRARGDGAIREWMERNAPTEAQMNYLSRLGHRGPAPATRQLASDAIDALVKGVRR